MKFCHWLSMVWPFIPLATCMCGKLLFHRKLSAIIESTAPSFFGSYKNRSINLSAWLFNLSKHIIFCVVIPLLMILKSTLICFQLFKVFSIMKKKIHSLKTAVLSSYHPIFLFPVTATISLWSTSLSPLSC